MNFLARIHIGLLLYGLLTEAARIFGESPVQSRKPASRSAPFFDVVYEHKD